MKRAVINLTPLLDVVLILLFTFMIKVDADQGKALKRMEEQAFSQDTYISVLEKDISRLDRESRDLSAALVQKRLEVDEFRKAAEGKEAELSRSVARLSVERDRVSEQVVKLAEEVRTLSRTLSREQDRGQDFREDAADREKRLTESLASVTRERNDLVASEALLEKERDRLETVLAGLEKERDRLGAVLAGLEKKHEALSDRSETVRRQNLDLAAAINGLKIERDQLTADLEVARKKESRMVADLEATRTRESLVVADLEAARKTEKDQTAALKEAERRTRNLAVLLDESGKKLRAAEDDMTRLRSKIREDAEASRTRVRELTTDLESIRKKRDELSNQLARTAKEVPELSRSLAEAEKTVRRLEDEARRRAVERVKDEAAWGAERARLETELKAAGDRLADADRQIAALKAQAPVSADDIRKSLLAEGAGTEPRVFLHINFEFNRAELNFQGRVQADQLGLALTDPIFDGKRFILIGHTDVRGTEDFNQRLSEQRAAAVMGYLVAEFGIAPNRIKSEGRGESETLYTGDREHVHALNRRVEVRIAAD